MVEKLSHKKPTIDIDGLTGASSRAVSAPRPVLAPVIRITLDMVKLLLAKAIYKMPHCAPCP